MVGDKTVDTHVKTQTSSWEGSTLPDSETEVLQRLEHAPPFWRSRKRLSKQLSMCETTRDRAWERRRRHQMMCLERRKQKMNDSDDLTDYDLNELKGCIELGFGFNEEEGQKLCSTLPALDLYFAVNRQFATSPISLPNSKGPSSITVGSLTTSMGFRSSSFDNAVNYSGSWRICSPGDSSQQVKIKLRHWAQAVACSVMQSQ